MTKEELSVQNADLEAELAKKEAELAEAMEKLKAMEANAAQPEPEAKGDPRRRPTKIKLFKDSKDYKDALYVNVNDYNAMIPRGVPVVVPYFVAKMIRETEEQDTRTAGMVEQYEADWDRRVRELERM